VKLQQLQQAQQAQQQAQQAQQVRWLMEQQNLQRAQDRQQPLAPQFPAPQYPQQLPVCAPPPQHPLPAQFLQPAFQATGPAPTGPWAWTAGPPAAPQPGADPPAHHYETKPRARPSEGGDRTQRSASEGSSTTAEPTDEQVQDLLASVEEVVLENLATEVSGSMSLATLGNRVPKALMQKLKSHGFRFAKFVTKLESIQVDGMMVHMVGGPQPHGAADGAACRRGEFMQAVRDDTLSEGDRRELHNVLDSVHELLSMSDRPSESACALGNKLAPRARAFLRSRRARLVEILNHFPDRFESLAGRSGGTAHFSLVGGSP